MKISSDERADALYIKLNELKIVDSEEIWDNINCDYDTNNVLVGIEIISLKQQMWDLYEKMHHLLSAEDLDELSQFFKLRGSTLWLEKTF
ncbi:MAG: DUF2283 domain-containing protein [Tatlockia sp.]|jgi:uncharacterized protein YuzE|nr:DUF2283 domain-containing protein [Tatlockia sp.]